MEITWYGTAALLMSSGGYHLLFDPFFPLNRELDCCREEDFRQAGAIMLTHGHFDHAADLAKITAAHPVPVYCSETIKKALLDDGVPARLLNTVVPGEELALGPFQVKVLRGRHIKFNLPLILQTLFLNPRLATHFGNLRKIAGSMRRYPAGQVLIYQIRVEGKTIMHMGSLNIDPEEDYPRRAEVLTFPYQGRSDLDRYSMPLLRKLQPASILLHHFDDTFPPISRPINLKPLQKKMSRFFPEIKIIAQYRQPIAL